VFQCLVDKATRLCQQEFDFGGKYNFRFSEGFALAEIIGVSKEELGARFGYALPGRQVGFVREDLPRCVRAFVNQR